MTPSTTWHEDIAADEEARFTAYAQELLALQQRNAGHQGLHRALHAKGMPGVRAVFEVLPDLPDIARVGLFAQPATYQGWVRYSNGSGAHQPDRKPDIRGIAIKLAGVGGRKLIPGMEDETTQDFLLIRSAATPVRDADEFMALVRASTSPLTGVPRLAWRLGLRRLAKIAASARQSLGPVASLATTPFYSALPVQFGAHAIHYALQPRDAAQALTGPGADADYLGQELATRLARGPVQYDFQIQFYSDPQTTPIEDASVVWPTPFVTVARLTLPQQDMNSAEGRELAAWIETLSFDPWHTQVEFRPLGNMMRARNVAYRFSTQARGAAAEPRG